MPSCPLCETDYPVGTAACPKDGMRLAPTGGTAAATVGGGVRAAAAEIASAPTLPEPLAAPAAAAAPAESFDSLIGATLAGRYQIVRRIGEGGMGAVYEAKHTVIGKRVAVKVLLEKFHSNTDFVARLLQEARLASSIGHENIVDVTDFGTTDDGRSFVVMEFLDGEPLAQLVMREAPLPVERSLRVARQAASALSAAHAKGIFHRDVKPENIYLVRRGDADFVKVVDFGISKAVKQGGDEGGESYRLTHTGLLLGTPLYMSPEQARGEESLDHRVDIWALGVMLYECLTGEVPFHANNYLGIISQVLTREPLPPSKLRPELGIPAAVETVVMRAMEKDRDRRYQTMAELERDLDRLLAGDQNVGLSAVPAPVTPPEAAAGAPGRWRLVVAGAVVIAVGVAVALRQSRDGAAPPAPAAAAVAAPPAAVAAPPPASGGVAPAAPAPIPAEHPAAAGAGPAEVTRAVAAARPARSAPATAIARRKPAARGERKAGGESTANGQEKVEPSESAAKRGVLPLRSREAYPE